MFGAPLPIDRNGSICEACGGFLDDDEAAGLPPLCTGCCISPPPETDEGATDG